MGWKIFLFVFVSFASHPVHPMAAISIKADGYEEHIHPRTKNTAFIVYTREEDKLSITVGSVCVRVLMM